LHGPNGFFRRFAGSPATVLKVIAHGEDDAAKLLLRIIDGGDGSGAGRHRRPIAVTVSDAYGRDRRVEVDRAAEIIIDTEHAGGWYDLALTTQSDSSFGYQLAGRLESRSPLTSDPQLGRG
jgi:phospholipase C